MRRAGRVNDGVENKAGFAWVAAGVSVAAPGDGSTGKLDALVGNMIEKWQSWRFNLCLMCFSSCFLFVSLSPASRGAKLESRLEYEAERSRLNRSI